MSSTSSTARTYTGDGITGRIIEDTPEAWDAEVYLSGAEAEYYEHGETVADTDGDWALANELGRAAAAHRAEQSYAAQQLARVCAETSR